MFLIELMLSRKNISGFLVMLLLAMQLLLAQHYTVHFNDDVTPASSGIASPAQAGQDDSPAQDRDSGPHDKLCQLCVLSKSLLQLVLFALAAITFIVQISCSISFVSDYSRPQNRVAVYPARAPPVFLS